MGSLSAAGTTVVATVAMARTGEASLWDGGMFYVYYSFAFPLLMFAGMEVLELWLNYLPPQVRSCVTILQHYLPQLVYFVCILV